MKTQHTLAWILNAAMAISACRTATTPTPAPTEAPVNTPVAIATPALPPSRVTVAPVASPTPRPQPTSLPPLPTRVPSLNLPFTPVGDDKPAARIIQYSPEINEQIKPDGVVEVVFDRAMDQASVAAALVTQPKIEGTLSWNGPRTVRFKPAGNLPRTGGFVFGINQSAKSTEGAPLQQPFEIQVFAQGNLEITQTIPDRNADEVQPDTIITIMFNRPVVPLGTISGGPALPSPVSFDPPLVGNQEWLNTSVLVFKPEKPLPGGTKFTGKIANTLQDTDGAPMVGEYTWQFSTSAPKVLVVAPNDAVTRDDPQTGIRRPQLPNPVANKARVDTAIRVTFNQIVDATSATGAFLLADARGTKIDGTAMVLSNTLIFTPSQRLSYDATYTVKVAAGVLSASGGVGGKEVWESKFTTYPLPRIARTTPVNNATNVPAYTSFSLFFNAPVNPDTIMPRLSMTPAFSPTKVYTYYNAFENSFTLNFGPQPATDYTVTIAPGIADEFGNVINDSLTVKFRTGNLPPNAQLIIPGGLATFDANLPVQIGLQSNNISRVNLALYPITLSDRDISDWLNADTAPPAPAERTWNETIGGTANQRKRTTLTLGLNDGKLKPGAYLFTLDSPDFPNDNNRKYRVQRVIVIVSEISMVMKRESAGTLVWATSHKTGAPVVQLPLELFNVQYVGNVRKITSLGKASTNAEGVAQFATKADIRNGYFFVLGTAPFTYVSSNMDIGDFPIDFNGRAYANDGGDVGSLLRLGTRGFVYTDRAIYRPGQKVFIKGMIRREDDVAFSLLPAGQEMRLTIVNARGETVATKNLKTDDWGGVDTDYTLADTAPTGGYRISLARVTALSQTDQQFEEILPQGGVVIGSANFTVAAYRPPEYEVGVTPATTQTVRGTTLGAVVEARYLSSGGLANTPVTWNVLASRSTFAPAQFEQYSFSDDDSVGIWDWWRPRPTPLNTPILQGSGTTDRRGRFEFNMPISSELRLPSFNNSQPELVSGTLRYSIEASASGADNQIISGRGSVTVHPAKFYAGVTTGQAVVEANKAFDAGLLVVDWDGKRIANRDLSLELVRREWKSKFDEITNGWTSEPIDEVITRTNVTSDGRGEAKWELKAPKAGTYRIVARVKDDDGRTNQAVRSVWATGSDFVPWFRENDDRIGLIANKTNFVPGETADVLIPSPFEGEHYALVTIERGHVLQHEVIKLTSNSQLYKVALTDKHVPNVYASVVLIASSQSGRLGGAYKLGSIELTVQPVTQVFKVQLSADTTLAQPGQTVNYTIRISDNAGKPVASTFTLDLVDKGILNLKPRTSDAIVKAFYGRRGLGVQTSVSLSASGNRFIDEEALGGRGGGGGAEVATADKAFEAPIARSAAPTSAQASAPSANAADGVVVRENFADTATWQPSVQTDADGKARVAIKLPDNLTTWVLRVTGADKATRVGEGLINVVANKPLLIRPVTPRFLVVGDVIELSAIVNNNTANNVNATATLRESKGLSLTTSTAQAISIDANSEAVVRWAGKVLDVPQVDVLFQVVGGAYNDASRPRLSTAPNGGIKVLRYSTAEVVGTAGQITGAGSRTELIVLPPRLDNTQGNFTVRTDASLLSALQPGLKYLETYPYESAEAVTSSFLPNALTLALLKEFKQADPALEALLKTSTADALDKLYRTQHSDGGWGWFKEQESHIHTTLYVVFGMLRAKEAGLAVRQDVIDRALNFLTPITRANVKTLPSVSDFNQMAYVAYIFGSAKRPLPTVIDGLYDQRDRLSLYAKALLALTIGQANGSDVRLKTLFADLNAKVIQSATGAHWEETSPDWYGMNSDLRTTALILMAIAKHDAKNAIAPNALRWLLSERNANGYWSSTYESAWVMIAFTEWARATNDAEANFEYGANLNGKDVIKSQASASAQSLTFNLPIAELVKDTANRLLIARGAGDGRLYYTAHLKAYLPVPDVKALNRGIQVQRRFVAANCTDGAKCPSITQAKLGETVRVEVSLIAPTNLYFVALEDTLPAGAELVDTGLATTSQLAIPPSLSRSQIAKSPFGWWWNWYSRSELRDDRVALFARYLPKGSYDYSYSIRLTSPGQFNVIPTFASQQYFPEVFGRGDGALFTVVR